jgi:Transposase
VADGDPAVWTTDLKASGAALLIALLVRHSQQLPYIPGRIVRHAATTYRGDGKTDAKDARITADQARMPTDLQLVRGADQISADLRLLTDRPTDLVTTGSGPPTGCEPRSWSTSRVGGGVRLLQEGPCLSCYPATRPRRRSAGSALRGWRPG